MPANPPDPLIGATLGPCRIESLLGSGGMGAVYKARHLTLERPVALKLLSSKENAKAAALAEARAAAKLDDPRIVGIHEVGEDAGRPYIVMQWIDGESLESRVARSGPLPPDQALAVMKETLAALAVAHEAGIVHRDVKPANIMLTAKGGVKLADFGLAVSAGGGADGDPVGTFLFMAPEQGFGQAADPRIDLYALGGTWYYALTGKPPFGVDSTKAILRHRDEDPPDAAAAAAGVTRKNADLIRRLMAKAPGERPASAKEALKECSAYGFLLETSALGDSPFQLNAPPPKPAEPVRAQAPVAAQGAMPGAAHAAPAPRIVPVAPPPPPPAPAAGGSRAMFGAILGVFVLAGVGTSFLKAAAQDWVAASLFLSLLPAALTFGDRLEGWRKPVGALAWAGSLACAALYAGAGFSSIEAMALAGLGAACGVAAVYLGLWGQDKTEALSARGLAPVGGVMLAVAAVTWGAAEGQGFGAALSERGGAFCAAFSASAGPWRWLGVVIMTAAVAVALRMKTPGQKAEPDRKLNWNR